MKFLDRYINGTLLDAYKYFGTHKHAKGFKFRVFAPNAEAAYVVGSFNGFIPQRMKRVDKRGLYELVIDCQEYDEYKYMFDTPNGRIYKADPFAFHAENRPGQNSKVYDLTQLTKPNYIPIKEDEPVVIYEMHLGSFNKNKTYQAIAKDVVAHCKEFGFTHIELLPIYEHPFDQSWGYQGASYYAPTARYGNPLGLFEFIEESHKAGIGVILDFVPGHFVADAHALGKFDGTALYERSDHLEYTEWGTLNADLGKGITVSYMLSCMNYYTKLYGFDGIRIDAVSNIIYERGVEGARYEAGIHFLKRMNQEIDTVFFAEDSSMYDGVTKDYGLDFDYKWCIGYMNTTLEYFKKEPVYRKYHFNELVQLTTYPFSEKYLLEYSHDEVVHCKGSLFGKMPGYDFDKFANLRLMLAMMFLYPGKKLLFMGSEFAQVGEWDCLGELDFYLMEHRQEYMYFVKQLIQFYKTHPVFFKTDFNHESFRVEAVNHDYCILHFSRTLDETYDVILNTIDVEYEYDLGFTGEVLFSSDASEYGGNGIIELNKEVTKVVLPKLSLICVRRVRL